MMVWRPAGGLSLAELLVSLAVLGLVLAGLFGILHSGVKDPTRERVTFLVRAGESVLRRDAGGGAQPIIENVRRFGLTYFDSAGAPTTDPARVRSVLIRLEVGLAGPVAVMETQVSVRNNR